MLAAVGTQGGVKIFQLKMTADCDKGDAVKNGRSDENMFRHRPGYALAELELSVRVCARRQEEALKKDLMIYLFIHVYTCIHMYVCMYTHAYYLPMYVYAHMCVHVHRYARMHVGGWVQVPMHGWGWGGGSTYMAYSPTPLWVRGWGYPPSFRDPSRPSTCTLVPGHPLSMATPFPSPLCSPYA